MVDLAFVIGLVIAALIVLSMSGIVRWSTIAIVIGASYGLSTITDIHMGSAWAAALGLFLLMGVCVDIYEWFVNRTSPRWHSSGEPGSGMDEGE